MEGPYITFFAKQVLFLFSQTLALKSKRNSNSQVSALGLFGIFSAYNAVLMHAYMCLCASVCVTGVGEDFAMPLAVKERKACCHQQKTSLSANIKFTDLHGFQLRIWRSVFVISR